jgi:hypothetical protein
LIGGRLHTHIDCVGSKTGVAAMANGRSIDHIVLAVGRLEDAARRYEALGFMLTPRAEHDARMGTSNRLAQFAARNFIELLEADRPATLAPHDFSASPSRFSFGAHNRDFAARRDGLSMLILSSRDSTADAAAFARSGIGAYAPFEFERQAALPDGRTVTVAFGLAFAACPEMPQIAFAACHHKTPEHLWNPTYQAHPNGARGIAAVYLVAEQPERHRHFLTTLIGAPAEDVTGGFRVPCGAQALLVVTPARLYELAPAMHFDLSDGPQLAGFAIEVAEPAPPLTPASEACGAFIEWRRI